MELVENPPKLLLVIEILMAFSLCMLEGPGCWNSVHVITSYYGYETGIATGNRYMYILRLSFVMFCPSRLLVLNQDSGCK